MNEKSGTARTVATGAQECLGKGALSVLHVSLAATLPGLDMKLLFSCHLHVNRPQNPGSRSAGETRLFAVVAAETPNLLRLGSGGLRPAERPGVGFTDSATFVAVSFQVFVGDFRPKFFEFRRPRLERVPFGFILKSTAFSSAPYVSTYDRKLG